MTLNESTYRFLEQLADYSHTLSGLDHVWNILFPSGAKRWEHLRVSRYRETFYVAHINGESGTLEVEPEKEVRLLSQTGVGVALRHRSCAGWEALISSASDWLKVVRKDWIKANRRVVEEYPLQNRYGTAPHALIRASLPDIYRLDEELGNAGVEQFVRLVEGGFFMKTENTEVVTMTAEDYFRYCRIAYIAGKRADESIDEKLSGREMYCRYADGRHEGLLDIPPDSADEFADWIDGTHPKRTVGGHPWEIKRGGNTTHIDLIVSRQSPYRKEGFKVVLRAESTGRLAETVRMLLAIREAGLPISIADPEAIRKRLLAQDNIGIIPSYCSLHRASQHFPATDDVFDVLHCDDLGRFKRRITPFITWEPLAVLKPKDCLTGEKRSHVV
jgi:hypothetical protein